ncbi:hypothetical protein JYU34_014722 [Plutella xylostella]|uniref:ABC transporter domain-containing protein n=1 Tax=Plutella xylostella TaxID=51655 RepID=A0ABQ7Q928_PLUXY|nr:hypothetical protein JYU34_014722 [Plutella xylostella]
MFLADLTVLEHVMFFTMLKGGSLRASRVSSMQLLREMHLDGKAASRVTSLSGGMMRRLQLTMALAGGAEVLILDEPTSGLDVETRRDLWNKLLTLRGDRTVVLTTHFMEEADALGDRVALLHGGRVKCHATPMFLKKAIDRVALLHGGRVKCHATPMFLKKAIGSGYRLTIATTPTASEPTITAAIQSVVGAARLNKREGSSLTYNLPAAGSARFPLLFNHLEQGKGALGIDYMGVGVTTLEEVFLRLGRDSDDEIDTVGSEVPPQFDKKSGWPLVRSQVAALVTRQARFTYSKKIVFLVFETIIPLLLIYGLTYLTNTSNTNPKPAMGRVGGNRTAMDLGLYRRMGDSSVLYRVNVTEPKNVAAVTRRFDNARVDVMRGSEDISKLAAQNHLLSIIDLNDTDAKVHFTTIVRHAAPTGLNLLSNMLASIYLDDAAPDAITTYNDPVISGVTRREAARMVKGKEKEMMMSWMCFVCLCLHLAVLSNVVLAIRERATGSRASYIMCRVTPTIYWLSSLAYQLMLATVVVMLPTLAIVALAETDQSVDYVFILSIFASAWLGTLSLLAFMYALSFTMGPVKTQLIVLVLVGLFGIYAAGEVMRTLWDANLTLSIVKRIIVNLGKIIPAHHYMTSLIKSGEVARLNSLCRNNRGLCPAIPVSPMEENFDLKTCCDTGSVISTFSGHKLSPLGDWFIMIILFLIYMGLTILTQYGYLSGGWDYFFNTLLKKYKPRESPYDNAHVKNEAAYVAKTVGKPQSEIQESLLVHDLHKNYFKLCSKSVNAVRGINLTVKKGECFGLLGVNGAGKSTTFKLLTMEGTPTRGRMFANGHFLNGKQSHDYLWSVSYCPQLLGLDEFLTGRQTLRLLLTLAGLRARDVRAETDAWLEVVGLTKYADSPVSTYSGGCVRRLGAAGALCRRAPLALLDEPTAGVDPASRRRVWRALRANSSGNSSVLISSHSMDEMEALCHRIAILNQGWVCALGDLGTLRRDHAAGHSLQIKLKRETTDIQMQKLKEDIKQKFKCTLKDEHKSMLYYNIDENLPYSDMFTRIEELKAGHSIIEDYTVHEMTLEEVFLNLAHGNEAKKQQV